MKISAINNNSVVNNKNFQGLWSKTSHSCNFDSGLGVFVVKDTFYYHPFSDETQDEINKVVDDNSFADVVCINGEENPKYVIKECKICKKLPFNKSDFEMYSQAKFNTPFTSLMKKIHKEVQTKFINKNFGEEQISAVNYIW